MKEAQGQIQHESEIYRILAEMTASGRAGVLATVITTRSAAAATDFGAIASVPITKDGLTYVDTWAGRGGFGSRMFQHHNIAAIVYGGTVVEEDFRDRKFQTGG